LEGPFIDDHAGNRGPEMIDGDCLGLVVVDAAGVSLAHLDDTDPQPVTVAHVAGLVEGRPQPEGVLA
jgi:hypothetical protein